MSADVRLDVQQSFKEADKAMAMFNGALLKFNAAIQHGDWKEAEKARAIAHVVLDGYLDNMGGAYKRMQSERA